MAQLFQELVKNDSIKVFSFGNSIRFNLDTDVVRSMIPFLQNSPQLIKFNLSKNNIDSQAFDVLVHALDGESIEELHLDKCNITDISTLGHVTLPHLQTLNLAENIDTKELHKTNVFELEQKQYWYRRVSSNSTYTTERRHKLDYLTARRKWNW